MRSELVGLISLNSWRKQGPMMERENKANPDAATAHERECQPENDMLFRRMWAIEQAVTLMSAAMQAGSRPPDASELVLLILTTAASLKHAIDSEEPLQFTYSAQKLFEKAKGEGLGFAGHWST